MSRSSSEERNKTQKCPFEVYRSEGDAFLIKKMYSKAIMAYNQALYIKAQILYNKGDFEHALMFFHRGQQQRPELQMFRLGIQKCEEAVENSLKDHKKVKIASGGAKGFAKQMEDEEKAQVMY
ncbi:unnamed protein product [Trichobilharzia regenti]|nr:unnamed protein product [Trichobilharzia regenti]